MRHLPSLPPISHAFIRRHGVAYASAAASHPTLCRLPTLEEAASSVVEESPLDPFARAEVVRALVELSQQTPHPVWSHLVLAAFDPLLRELVGECDSPEAELERIGEASLAILEAVARADLSRTRLPLHVDTGARAALGRHDLAEVEWNDAAVLVEDMDVMPATDEHPLAGGLTRAPGDGHISDERLLATLSHHGALRTFVRAAYAGQPDGERDKAYCRLVQRRARLARRARKAGNGA